MNVDLLSAQDLTDSDITAWRDVQRADPAFDNPYFHPEFTRCVGAVRADVEVAVLREQGRAVGFFPFQRASARCGKPVGGRLSDFQAVVLRPGVSLDPASLLRGCGLHVWDYDHLLVSQESFAGYRYLTDGSPYIALEHGFDSYCQRRRALGDEELRQSLRKGRKLSREVGPLRLEPVSQDDSLLHKLFTWKSAQYQRTHITDVFAFPWTRQLLSVLHARRSPDFAGILSALWAGNRVVALHFGLLGDGVLHYWFPAYDTELAAYSPGRVLLLELMRQCRELGVRRIDLGRGMAPYKTRLMTGCTEVAAGSVDLRPVTSVLRARWRDAQNWVRSSPWRRQARWPARALYRLREWWAFQ